MGRGSCRVVTMTNESPSRLCCWSEWNVHVRWADEEGWSWASGLKAGQATKMVPESLASGDWICRQDGQVPGSRLVWVRPGEQELSNQNSACACLSLRCRRQDNCEGR